MSAGILSVNPTTTPLPQSLTTSLPMGQDWNLLLKGNPYLKFFLWRVAFFKCVPWNTVPPQKVSLGNQSLFIAARGVGAGGEEEEDFGWNRMVFRGDGERICQSIKGGLKKIDWGGGERDQAQFIATQPNSSSLPLPPPPFTSSKKHSSSWYEKSKGSTYIITGITISIGPQSFGSGIILETLRALHFFHVVLRKFRVAIRGAAAMIQNKSCNATFPQDTPGYNELENSWHALLLSRFFSPKPLFPSPSLPFQCYLDLTKWSLVSGNIV